jgi:hypothetical protein
MCSVTWVCNLAYNSEGSSSVLTAGPNTNYRNKFSIMSKRYMRARVNLTAENIVDIENTSENG